MRSILFYMLLTGISLSSVYSQQLDSIPDEHPEFEYYDSFSLSPEYDCAIQAARDIKEENPRFIICFNRSQSGTNGSAFYSNQRSFEAYYGVEYKLYTCTSDNEKCIKKYNRHVAKHLSKTFGRKWRKKVRKDVLGI